MTRARNQRRNQGAKGVRLNVNVIPTGEQLRHSLNYTLAEKMRLYIEGDEFDAQQKQVAQEKLEEFPDVKAAYQHLAVLRSNPEETAKLADNYESSSIAQEKKIQRQIRQRTCKKVGVSDEFYSNAMLVTTLVNGSSEQNPVDWGKKEAPVVNELSNCLFNNTDDIVYAVNRPSQRTYSRSDRISTFRVDSEAYAGYQSSSTRYSSARRDYDSGWPSFWSPLNPISPWYW